MELFLVLGLVGLVVAIAVVASVAGVVLLPFLLLGAVVRFGFELLILPFIALAAIVYWLARRSRRGSATVESY